MKRFLMCGGVWGSETALDWLRELVAQRRPDGLLFAGGILHPDREYAPTLTEWGMTREDARFMQRFFETLGELHLFTAVIPGPFDTTLEDFFHMGLATERESPALRLAHATLIEDAGVAVCGIGGSLAEDEHLEADTFSRIRADYFLRTLDRASHPYKVLLLPAPPPSLGGTRESRLIDSLIESHPADLCIVAGPTDHRGIQRISQTRIINPGCLADGSAAWLEGGRLEFIDDSTSRTRTDSRHQSVAGTHAASIRARV
jgi:hypothetical protein